MTVRELLVWAVDVLRGGSGSAELDAEILLAHVLNVKRVLMIVEGEKVVEEKNETRFREHVTKRRTGVPIAYLVGKKEFYGRDFFVNEHVLVPRPETEMIVDVVKAYAVNRVPVGESRLRLLDIGTGSGCLAVTLQKELEGIFGDGLKVVASDISQEALVVAQKNALSHAAAVEFRHGSLYDVLVEGEQFDVIVSNLPYVEQSVVDASVDLQAEPAMALTPQGLDGFALVEQVIRGAKQWLTKNGLLVVEIGYDQGERARQRARSVFSSGSIQIQKDLAGFDRIVIARPTEVL